MDQEPKTGLVIENDLERFGIEIIAPDDPRFEAEFKTYTGDSQTVLPLLDAAMPLAFFLRNHAEHEIVGISFRWVTTDPSGKSRVRETSVNHPGALIGMKPRDPWMVGKTSIVNPGQTQFITYFDAVRQCVKNAGYRAKYKEINYGPDMRADEVDRLRSHILYERSQMLGGVVDLSVSIDAVIFDDGAFIGDNKTWYLEGRRGLIQAELDFRRSLKELDAASLSDTEIIERLIESLPNERPHLVPPKSSGEHFSSGQEAYNFIYLATEHNLREDLEHRQQMNRSVGEILGSYRMRNESDYRELRRIAND